MASIRKITSLDNSAYDRKIQDIMRSKGLTRFIAEDGHKYPIVSQNGKQFVVLSPDSNFQKTQPGRMGCPYNQHDKSFHPLNTDRTPLRNF